MRKTKRPKAPKPMFVPGKPISDSGIAFLEELLKSHRALERAVRDLSDLVYAMEDDYRRLREKVTADETPGSGAW